MKFALPVFLWLLLAVPLAAWLLWRSGRKRQELMSRFVSARLLDSLTAGVSASRRKLRSIVLLSSLALLVLAVARPQWGFQWEEVKQRGLDIIVAIDTSRSMLAEDIKPNRLERAKLAAMDLAAQAKSDRIGLVAFAGSAFLQCPLTLDDAAFRQSLTLLDVEIIPQGGTAIAEAIDIATTAFTTAGENHRVLILFTDGEDHEEGVMEAAKKADKEGIKVFTVGMGTTDGEILRTQDQQGRSKQLLDKNGKPVQSRLDERLLGNIASAAGGFYLRLAGAKTMENLYEKGLAPLPKSDHSARLVKQYYERYHWPLGIAMLLLILEILMPDRTFRETFSLGRRTLVWAVSFIILSSVSNAGATSVSEAQNHLAKGRYRAAMDAYRQLLIKNPEDPRLQYNLGIAAYNLKDYDTAAKAFNAATASPQNLELQQQALYNGGNTLFRQGESASEFEEKKKYWQKATNLFSNALQLNSKDTDAKFNMDYTVQKIKELEQQQQQQQQQSENNQDDQKDNKDNKDNKDQQSQNKQDQQKNQQQQQSQKKDQQQQQQQAKDQSGQKKEDQEKQSQQQQQQAQNKDQQQQNAQQQQAGKHDKNAGQTNAQSATAQQTMVLQMTPEQALKLLEAAKMEEKALIFLPPSAQDPSKQNRSIKNW